MTPSVAFLIACVLGINLGFLLGAAWATRTRFKVQPEGTHIKYWTKKKLKKEEWGNDWYPGWYEYHPGAQWKDGDDLLDPSIWRDPSDD